MTEKIWTWQEFCNLPLDQKTGCIDFGNDYKEWYKEGELHRLDGPAFVFNDTDIRWYKEGKLHRLDGPAIERSNGTKIWYKEGRCHRLEGPAGEYPSGYKIWFIEGKEYTEEEFKIKAFVILNGLEKFL